MWWGLPLETKYRLMVVSGMSVQKSLKSFSLVALTVFSLCFSGQVNADPACDATFMTAMKQKAWMEAQREIMIAQSIIAKPDSVFALGCFGAFHQTFWGSITFQNKQTYATTTLQSDITNYLNASFNHPYGGGHDPAVGATNTLSNNCAIMLNLWNDARCSNLDIAKIKTLTETSTYNRDAFPAACTGPGAWATPLATFSTKTAGVSVGATFDDMNLFAGVTAPLSQLTSNKCSAGLPTGVKISSSSDEVVCPNPGCTPNGASPQKCCKATVSNGSLTFDQATCSP